MQRRRLLQTIIGAPAAAALPVPGRAQQPPASDFPVLETTGPGAGAASVPRFFTSEQFGALRSLGERIMPASGSLPGASAAGAAEFLDFLISRSPADRQTLYRTGLDQLNRRGAKPFAELSDTQAGAVLAPLREAFTYPAPSDPFARFLHAAKADFLMATRNSREWAEAEAGRTRGAAGVGLYWLPIE